MIGRTLCSVVVPGLLVARCLCEPLHAGQDSQRKEPQQNIFEGIILPPFNLEAAVWVPPTMEQKGPDAQVDLSSPRYLSELFENFDVLRGPVPHRAPTHADMIETTTPLEFRAPAAISFDVIGLALLTSKWVEVQVGATRSYAIWAVTA